MTRQEANQELIEEITKAVIEGPDLRFGQILRNLGIIDTQWDCDKQIVTWRNGFYEESVDTLKRVNKED